MAAVSKTESLPPYKSPLRLLLVPLAVHVGLGEQGATFLLVFSTLTLLNQLGAAGSIAVFNNGEKNEKILKVAILSEWLSGERETALKCNLSSPSS